MHLQPVKPNDELVTSVGRQSDTRLPADAMSVTRSGEVPTSEISVGVATPWVSRRAGGLQHSVRRLAQCLNETVQCRVQVFSVGDSHACEDVGLWSPLPVNVSRALGPASLRYAPGLVGAMRRGRLDLLHTHGIWTYLSHATRQVATRSRIPYVISPRGMLDPWALRRSRFKKHVAYRCFERAHLVNASAFCALCDSEARAIRDYGLKSPVFVIPNGVDVPDNRKPPGVPEWQMKGMVRRGERILLYLGRIHPKKGLENLLRAWSTVSGAGSGRDWSLVIAGWDQVGHQRQLKEMCRELSLHDSVVFVGPQFGEEKDRTLASADAFILPSFSEGLPMTVLEAWSFSRPVIITPQCNLPIAAAANAALVASPDVVSLQQSLTTLVAMSNTERTDMGRRGFSLVRNRFDWETVANQTLSMYNWLLGGGQKPDSAFD